MHLKRITVTPNQVQMFFVLFCQEHYHLELYPLDLQVQHEEEQSLCADHGRRGHVVVRKFYPNASMPFVLLQSTSWF